MTNRFAISNSFRKTMKRILEEAVKRCELPDGVFIASPDDLVSEGLKNPFVVVTNNWSVTEGVLALRRGALKYVGMTEDIENMAERLELNL